MPQILPKFLEEHHEIIKDVQIAVSDMLEMSSSKLRNQTMKMVHDLDGSIKVLAMSIANRDFEVSQYNCGSSMNLAERLIDAVHKVDDLTQMKMRDVLNEKDLLKFIREITHLREIAIYKITVLRRALNLVQINLKIDIAGIKKILEQSPDQVPAVAEFEISQGKLAVAAHLSSSDPQDGNAPERSRIAALMQNAMIVSILQKSNCDPRLIKFVEEFSTLLDPINAMQLGMQAFAGERVIAAAKDEIGDVVWAQLSAHIEMMGQVAAQYEDWQTFNQNAASVELQDSDINEVRDLITEIEGRISAHPEIAENDVSDLLTRLRKALDASGRHGRRAGVAALRTMQNLLVAVAKFGLRIFSAAGDGTVKATEKAAEKLTYNLLISLPVTIPAAMTSSSWLGHVRTILETLLKSIG